MMMPLGRKRGTAPNPIRKKRKHIDPSPNAGKVVKNTNCLSGRRKEEDRKSNNKTSGCERRQIVSVKNAGDGMHRNHVIVSKRWRPVQLLWLKKQHVKS